jgi:hypothetical protein
MKDKINLYNVENDLCERQLKLESIESEYECIINKVQHDIDELKHIQKMLLNDYDVNRIKNAKRFFYTEGVKKHFYGDACSQLWEAIKDVSKDCPALLERYFGCKNYEGWTGQAVNCNYGYAPTHGYVVMEIGTTNEYRAKKIIPNEDDFSDILYFLHKLVNENDRNNILTDNE